MSLKESTFQCNFTSSGTQDHRIYLGIENKPVKRLDDRYVNAIMIKEVSYFFDGKDQDQESDEQKNFIPYLHSLTGGQYFSCYLTTDDKSVYCPIDDRSFANFDISNNSVYNRGSSLTPFVQRFDDDKRFGLIIPSRSLRLVIKQNSGIDWNEVFVVKIKFMMLTIEKDTYKSLLLEMK